MNTDFDALQNLQPGLNAGLVVLLSAIAGLLAFALGNALYVVHMRRRRLAQRPRGPLASRARHITGAAAAISLLAFTALNVPGPTLVEGKGWLSGDDLFTVSSRSGFVASYPNADREVKEGETILQLARSAGPDELASAANRRALLAEELESTRLDTLRIDPLLVTAQAAAKDRLNELLDQKRTLKESQESLLRGAQRQQLVDQSRLDTAQKELLAARHELDQVESSFKIAAASYDLARRPGVRALLTQDEIGKREERVNVLRSRRAELHDRIATLTQERKRLQALTATSEATDSKHMALAEAEAARLDDDIVAAGQRADAAVTAIERDKVRAERQREYRIHQIELQIASLDELLNARQGALEVHAPWAGRVGFREPSPASARSDDRPLLVLYKPGSVSVKILVPADQVQLANAKEIRVNMQALIPEAAGATFQGRIVRGNRLPDGTGELQIAGDPPEAAIRELAAGSSVPVRVAVRRLNPLAAAGVSRGWWLAGSLAASIVLTETRLWQLRRRKRRGDPSDGQSTNRWLGIDWGGHPDEFLEYVEGVGVVPRKVRRAVAAVNVAEERRGQRAQIGIAESRGAQESRT